jgi:isoquinoline 1-oxidoreductase subunit beta
MTYHRNQQNVVITNVSRRGMLKGVAATGVFVLAVQFPAVRAAMAYATGAGEMAHGVVTNPHVFVSIDKDGTVSIVAHRAEMGNGAARTTLPMIVADELDADWSRVRVVQSPGDEETYGNQDTDGSRSVRHFIQPMRQIGAGARKMLEMAAARRWGVNPSEVEAHFHEVVHTTSGKKLGYGDLAADAATMPAPALDTLQLKKPSAFRYIGKGTVPVVDLFAITTGKAIYGQDVMLPGMKFAVVARPPVVQGKAASYDASATMKVPGVEKVVTIDGTPPPAAYAPLGGIAVIANSTWAALKGREALKIVWDDGPNGSYDSVAYKTMLEENVRKPGRLERNEGDVDAALASAAKVISAEYYSPHLAHVTMEPPAATDLSSEPGWCPRRHRQASRRRSEERDPAQHAARRRLRTQVEMGLRHRGGAAVQSYGRRPGQGGLDPRGRHPERFLSYRDSGTPGGRDRQGQQSRCLATPERRADVHVKLQARPEISGCHRAFARVRRHAVRRPQSSA